MRFLFVLLAAALVLASCGPTPKYRVVKCTIVALDKTEGGTIVLYNGGEHWVRGLRGSIGDTVQCEVGLIE